MIEDTGLSNYFGKILRMPYQAGWGGGGEETRSGTEKRCSHNLQSGHPE